MRILLVEDELLQAMIIEERLIEQGHEVLSSVTTAWEALEIAQHQRPDLILMDISLGGAMDGIELVREIQQSHDIPVIYLTASSDTKTIQRAKATKHFGFLSKPVEYQELDACIGRVCSTGKGD